MDYDVKVEFFNGALLGFVMYYNESMECIQMCSLHDFVETDIVSLYNVVAKRTTQEILFYDFLVAGLNHEVIHFACHHIGEPYLFDPLLRGVLKYHGLD